MNDWSINFAEEDIFASLRQELEVLLSPTPNGQLQTAELRRLWSINFLEDGWVSKYKLPQSNLTISYLREKVGVCIQMGNISRVYADLLKLETLFRLGEIERSAMIVPNDSYSAFLGSNHASYSRVLRDLTALDISLSVPLLLYSVSRNQA